MKLRHHSATYLDEQPYPGSPIPSHHIDMFYAGLSAGIATPRRDLQLCRKLALVPAALMVDLQRALKSQTISSEFVGSRVSKYGEGASSSYENSGRRSHYLEGVGPLLRFAWEISHEDVHAQHARRLFAVRPNDSGRGSTSTAPGNQNAPLTIANVVVIGAVMVLATLATVLGCLRWRNRSKKSKQQVRARALAVMRLSCAHRGD